MRYVVLMMTVVMLGIGLGACETIKGAGKDLQNAGEAIDRKI